MKIVIAYPFDGHQPNDIIDIDDVDAEQMIRDGKARPHTTSAPAKPAPTVKEA